MFYDKGRKLIKNFLSRETRYNALCTPSDHEKGSSQSLFGDFDGHFGLYRDNWDNLGHGLYRVNDKGKGKYNNGG